MEPRKMAVLGSGRVGRTLASGFIKHGHQVMLGSRDPSAEYVTSWLAENPRAAGTGTYPAAAEWAEWVFVAVPGTAVEATVLAANPENMRGKILVDVSNALTTADDDHLTLTWGIDDSSAQHAQRMAPHAHVVKAFNSSGVQMMIDPRVPCGPPTMPICGNDADAKADVSELLRDIGWEPADFGTIHSAGMVEALGLAWVQYGRMTGNWTHCYKLVVPEA